MISISDFTAFAKTQGITIEYRAKINECLVFDCYKSKDGRKLNTRYDCPEFKVIWFIQDYDINRTDLDILLHKYLDFVRSNNERVNNI